MRSIVNNIKYLYLIKMAKWFTLVMPVIVIFYQHNGLNMTDIMLLKSIYSIAVVCMEIPSGYFADVWGRRKTLVIGTFLGFLGYVVYSFSFGFFAFLIAEIILGIGHSLISGADSAIMYDSLLEQKKEKDYLKYEGILYSAGNFAEAIAGILGGLLAAISLKLPFVCQSLVAFIGFPAALFLVEPTFSSLRKHTGVKDIFNIVKLSLIKDKELKWNILYSSVIGCSTLTMAWFLQPFLKEAGIPVAWFGFIWTALNLFVGLTSAISYRIEKKLGQIKTSLLIALGISIGYIVGGLNISIAGLIIIVFFYLTRGIATPVLKEYINRITISDIRATVLSIRNFVIRLIFAIIAPLLGIITDRVSLKWALILSGFIFLIFSLICLQGIVKASKNR